MENIDVSAGTEVKVEEFEVHIFGGKTMPPKGGANDYIKFYKGTRCQIQSEVDSQMAKKNLKWIHAYDMKTRKFLMSAGEDFKRRNKNEKAKRSSQSK